MNQSAIETFSIFGVIVLCSVLGVMTLSTFYRIMAWLGSDGRAPEPVALRGVLNENTLATVHMNGAERFENVRIVGFTNEMGYKTRQPLPYDLGSLVILEDKAGKRFLVRAKAIRMIEIDPGGNRA